MLDPIRFRGDIPFYYDKSSIDFRQDPYERYDPMVIRQGMIHLSDELWNGYPMQNVQDYIENNVGNRTLRNILEIGCGVGRSIATLASQYSEAQCWGVDYSYQMLKVASDNWMKGNSTDFDFSKFGFQESISTKSKKLGNLNFGLAKCEQLPFDDASQDVVYSSFLLDRLDDPIQGLREMKRVVRSSGKIIILSPFNFTDSKQWEQLYPLSKFQSMVIDLGFEILDYVENIKVYEPLDTRKNEIVWNCVGMVLGSN